MTFQAITGDVNLLVARIWSRFSLAQLFAVTSFIVFAAGSLVIGLWVSTKIETSVTHHTAVTTALYMNSVIAPEIQELSQQKQLSANAIARLNYLHQETPLGEGVIAFKVWAPGGRIVYSNIPSLIGKQFPESEALKRAWAGEVTSELSELNSLENMRERALGTPLLELYSPIRASESKRIIAIAEFYEQARELESQLFEAKIFSWIVVYGVAFVMFALLYGIVLRGSRVISTQRKQLETKVHELSRLLAKNQELTERVQRASHRTTEINERIIRRISADLHDGPSQSLGFALLQLDGLLAEKPLQASASSRGAAIRDALTEALREIRNLSAEFTLPELESLNLTQVIERVTKAHQRRTASAVQLEITELPDQLSMPTKIAVYRLVQESLNNTYQHGFGIKQVVKAWSAGGALQLEISDGGPGFEELPPQVANEHLGVLGMRERIESLGGVFSIESAVGMGTRVTAELPINMETENHAA